MTNDPVTSEFLRGNTEIIVLSILKRQPSHGYGLYTSFKGLESGFSLTPATLYPLLYRLERIGWIKSEWQESPKHRRQKIYSLTPEGHRALSARLDHWKRFTAAVNELLAIPPHVRPA